MTNYTATGLLADTNNTFTVRAVDGADNTSGNSNAATVRTLKSNNGGGGTTTGTKTLEPTDDIYFEGTRLYANEPYLRLEQARNRTVYLRFDGSTLSGSITKAELQLNIFEDPDTDNGTVKVYLGNRSNWNQGNISYGNRPTKGQQLASLRSGGTGLHTYTLDPGSLPNGPFTLIMEHTGTNDLAYAAAENANAPIRPKLTLTYSEDGGGNGGGNESCTNTGDTFWNECFGDLPDNAASDNGGTPWSTKDNIRASLKVVAGKLQYQGTQQAPNSITWSSGSIDISDREDVSIGYTVSDLPDGGKEAADHVKGYYVLDNGARVPLGEATGDLTSARTFTKGGINGNDLRIEIDFKTSWNDEIYTVDNITVNGKVKQRDTEAPSPPRNLAASNITQNAARLNWNASISNDVSGYHIYGNERLLATLGNVTSHTIGGMVPSTVYKVWVVALDGANNQSEKSNTITFSTKDVPDTTPPTAPSGLKATSIAQTSAAISWNRSSSTDVASYQLLLNGTLAGSLSNTDRHTLNGLAPSREYTIAVRAVDRSGNIGPPSNTIRVRTLDPVDNTPPTAPSGLKATSIAQTSAAISWNRSSSTDVASYQLLLNGTLAGSLSNTDRYTLNGLAPSREYTIAVRAVDRSGNIGPPSNTIRVRTLEPVDNTPTAPPRGLKATSIAQTSAAISWNRSSSTDVASYQLLLNGTLAGSLSNTDRHTLNGLAPSREYTIAVRAVDRSGNIGPPSNTIRVRTLDPVDNTPPTAPSGLKATSIAQTSAAISWNRSSSTDVASYQLLLNGTLAGSLSNTDRYTLNGLAPSREYTIAVRAVDRSGNIGPPSNTIRVRTLDPVDNTPSAPPRNLTVTYVRDTDLGLSWSASASGDVASYNLYNNNVLLQSGITTTSFQINGLTQSTLYRFTIKAVDRSENVGAESSVLQIRTQASDSYGEFADCDSSPQLNKNQVFANEINRVFSRLELGRVPHDLLLDYGLDLVDLSVFDGVLRGNNYMGPDLFRIVYNSAVSMRTKTDVPRLVSPCAFEAAWAKGNKGEKKRAGNANKSGTTLAMAISGLYYRYSKIASNALDANRIRVVNGQYDDVYSNGNWQNPYETKELFAMAMPTYKSERNNISLMLEANTWYSNQNAQVKGFAVDFGDGRGYRTMRLGETVTSGYSRNGQYTVTFRMQLNNGQYRYSRSPLEVSGFGELNGLTAIDPSCNNGRPVTVNITADEVECLY